MSNVVHRSAPKTGQYRGHIRGHKFNIQCAPNFVPPILSICLLDWPASGDFCSELLTRNMIVITRVDCLPRGLKFNAITRSIFAAIHHSKAIWRLYCCRYAADVGSWVEGKADMETGWFCCAKNCTTNYRQIPKILSIDDFDWTSRIWLNICFQGHSGRYIVVRGAWGWMTACDPGCVKTIFSEWRSKKTRLRVPL